MIRLIAFSVALLFAVFNAAAATKAIKFKKVWDGHRVIANAVVIVEGDKIQSVTEKGAIPKGAQTFDLSRYTGIPGMIDSHTHITYYWTGEPGTNPRRQPRRDVAVTVVLSQQHNGLKALEAGVTTVRDLNATGGADIDLRDLINMGALVGPRLFVSGVGLHGFNNAVPADPVAERIKQTKAVIDSGADWIKVFGSQGGFDNVNGDQTVSYEEMKTIVETAHAAGHKVAIHSYGPAGARDAIRAGGDTLEHATDMDDDTIKQMVEKKIWYVPTIDHNQYYVENAELLQYPPGAKEKLTDFIHRNYETAQKAYKAGARMLVGSDAVYNGWGLNMRELTWFVKMGMSNEQALETATVFPAEMLGKESSLGSIGPGYFADIVGIDGDPLANIEDAIKKVRWVMKGGEVVSDKTKSGM